MALEFKFRRANEVRRMPEKTIFWYERFLDVKQTSAEYLKFD